jgi:hypothetical protein
VRACGVGCIERWCGLGSAILSLALKLTAGLGCGELR